MHFKKDFNKKYKTNKISEVDQVQLSEFYKKTFYQDRDLIPAEDLFFSITLFPLTKHEQKIDNSLYN